MRKCLNNCGRDADVGMHHCWQCTAPGNARDYLAGKRRQEAIEAGEPLPEKRLRPVPRGPWVAMQRALHTPKAEGREAPECCACDEPGSGRHDWYKKQSWSMAMSRITTKYLCPECHTRSVVAKTQEEREGA